MARALLHGLLLCFALCFFCAGGAPQVITDVKSRQALPDSPKITVEGRNILVNDEVLHIKGVCWNPVPKGINHPNLDYNLTEPDTDLMVEAGINAVRLYVPIVDHSILDIFHSKGIWVIQVAYNWGGEPPEVAVPRHVNAVKDHPAILMYEVGNEWNYNKFYWDENEHNESVGLNDTEALQVAIDAMRLVKQNDDTRPVATNFGEIPTRLYVELLEEADVWGLNMYRGKDFRDAFARWAALSGKPMYVGEYGCDAWNNDTDQTDFDAQAECTRELTNQIVTNSVKGDPVFGVTSGGFIFELADEWWKAGDPNTHDSGGVAPGGGPWPDETFNEEWWGLLDTDRTEKRPAWHAYAEIEPPIAPAAKVNGPRNTVIIVVALLGVLTFGIVRMAPEPSDEQTGTELGGSA